MRQVGIRWITYASKELFLFYSSGENIPGLYLICAILCFIFLYFKMNTGGVKITVKVIAIDKHATQADH